MNRALTALLAVILPAAPAAAQVEAASAARAAASVAPAAAGGALTAAPLPVLPPSSALPAPSLPLAPSAALPSLAAPSAPEAPAAAVPAPRYLHAGLKRTAQGVDIAVVDGEHAETHSLKAPRRAAYREALSWLRRYAGRHGAAFASVSVAGPRVAPSLADSLWLKEDAVPVAVPEAESAEAAARKTSLNFVEADGLTWPTVHALPDGEVPIADLTSLAPYRRGMSRAEFRALKDEAAKVQGPIAFFSSTPQGGGVALMRHALIRLLRRLGVDARWYVLDPDMQVFESTKRKIHNVLQDVAPPGVELDAQDQARLQAWWDRNADKFEPVFRRAKTIVIDDYQPSGLIPRIRAVNPDARILYRSHIQIRADLADKKDTRQNRTWEFLSRNILRADAFISHPLEAFVPANVPRGKVRYMPATTDALDGLNKPLSAAQSARLMAAFDRRLALTGQTPLDPSRPYIVQVARFDPSKGIPTVIEAYARMRDRLRREGVPDSKAPQLVFAGHGAVDDTQGGEVFQKTLSMAREVYPRYAGDIKAASLPHSDQILDAVLRGALFAVQLSYAEGFEVKVTEALMKGVPVIGSRAGGIPLQIAEGRTGLLVPPADPDASAEAMHRLTTDAAYRGKLSRAAAKSRPPFLTQHNLLRWLRLARGAETL